MSKTHREIAEEAITKSNIIIDGNYTYEKLSEFFKKLALNTLGNEEEYRNRYKEFWKSQFSRWCRKQVLKATNGNFVEPNYVGVVKALDNAFSSVVDGTKYQRPLPPVGGCLPPEFGLIASENMRELNSSVTDNGKRIEKFIGNLYSELYSDEDLDKITAIPSDAVIESAETKAANKAYTGLCWDTDGDSDYNELAEKIGKAVTESHGNKQEYVRRLSGIYADTLYAICERQVKNGEINVAFDKVATTLDNVFGATSIDAIKKNPDCGLAEKDVPHFGGCTPTYLRSVLAPLESEAEKKSGATKDFADYCKSRGVNVDNRAQFSAKIGEDLTAANDDARTAFDSRNASGRSARKKGVLCGARANTVYMQTYRALQGYVSENGDNNRIDEIFEDIEKSYAKLNGVSREQAKEKLSSALGSPVSVQVENLVSAVNERNSRRDVPELRQHHRRRKAAVSGVELTDISESAEENEGEEEISEQSALEEKARDDVNFAEFNNRIAEFNRKYGLAIDPTKQLESLASLPAEKHAMETEYGEKFATMYSAATLARSRNIDGDVMSDGVEFDEIANDLNGILAVGLKVAGRNEEVPVFGGLTETQFAAINDNALSSFAQDDEDRFVKETFAQYYSGYLEGNGYNLDGESVDLNNLDSEDLLSAVMNVGGEVIEMARMHNAQLDFNRGAEIDSSVTLQKQSPEEEAKFSENMLRRSLLKIKQAQVLHEKRSLGNKICHPFDNANEKKAIGVMISTVGKAYDLTEEEVKYLVENSTFESEKLQQSRQNAEKAKLALLSKAAPEKAFGKEVDDGFDFNFDNDVVVAFGDDGGHEELFNDENLPKFTEGDELSELNERENGIQKHLEPTRRRRWEKMRPLWEDSVKHEEDHLKKVFVEKNGREPNEKELSSFAKQAEESTYQLGKISEGGAMGDYMTLGVEEEADLRAHLGDKEVDEMYEKGELKDCMSDDLVSMIKAAEELRNERQQNIGEKAPSRVRISVDLGDDKSNLSKSPAVNGAVKEKFPPDRK